MTKGKEISLPPQLGNILPSHELHQSLSGIDRCKNLFENFKLKEYLESINNYYLEGKGEITPLITKIISPVKKDDETGEMVGHNFDLSEGSWGGLHINLIWEKNEEEKPIKFLYLGLFYSQRYDYFQLYLEATKPKNKNGSITILKNFHRKFGLNPSHITINDVDDVLLNFTNDLIRAGIL